VDSLEAISGFLSYLINVFGYFGVFLAELVSSSSIFMPIPGFAATIVAATILNPFIVGILAGLGAAIGELTGYLLGLGGRKIVGVRGEFEFVRRLYRRYGLWTIYFFAATPSPFDVIGILCGLLKIDVRTFFFMTLAGKITSRIMLAITGKEILITAAELLRGQVDFTGLTMILLMVCFMLGSLVYWLFKTEKIRKNVGILK
jgi:uncharacterized membrane protein YdjX (TVP38/TMEM64 family)